MRFTPSRCRSGRDERPRREGIETSKEPTLRGWRGRGEMNVPDERGLKLLSTDLSASHDRGEMNVPDERGLKRSVVRSEYGCGSSRPVR